MKRYQLILTLITAFFIGYSMPTYAGYSENAYTVVVGDQVIVLQDLGCITDSECEGVDTSCYEDSECDVPAIADEVPQND